MIVAEQSPFVLEWTIPAAHHAPAVVEDRLPSYEQIKALELAIATELEQVELPLEHHFMPGVYIRKMTLPAGTVLVGKVHATEHACIVAKGRIAVVSETGRAELVAGDTFISAPGAKRVGYALEDTVFINVHTNIENDTDLAVLEAKLIKPEVIGYVRKEVVR